MLVDVRQDMQVVQEEIFGPVVVAMPFKDLDEILPVDNETVYEPVPQNRNRSTFVCLHVPG